MAYVGNKILFPVEIAATSFGICNAFARVVAIFSPLVAELKPDSISKYCFQGACFVAILAVTSLSMPA